MTPVEVLPEMTLIIPKLDLFNKVVWRKGILLDLDGVVVQYDFPKIVKYFFGVSLDSQSIFAYDLADVLGVSHSLINAMFKEQIHGKPNFIDGSLDVLKSWESKGYEIVIYSNRIKYMGKDGLIQWLIGNNIPFNRIDIEGKGRYDYHIDDSPGKLASTDSKHKLLYTQPWNKRCLDIKKQLTRVNSWREIEKIIG